MDNKWDINSRLTTTFKTARLIKTQTIVLVRSSSVKLLLTPQSSPCSSLIKEGLLREHAGMGYAVSLE